MNAPNTKPQRSSVGEALHCYGEAADAVEALYLQAQGEVTEEIEQAEAARDVSRQEAMEELIRYLRWLDGRDQLSAAERRSTAERLDRFDAATAKRREWAEGRLVALARVTDPEAKKARVGTFTVKLRDTVAIEAAADLDFTTLPQAWKRELAEAVKIIPAETKLDKNAAKADLLLGYREGPPRCDGWYDVEGHGRVWLAERDGDWWVANGPDDDRTLLVRAGLSIDPEPGLDVLRWKPSPPGVVLVHRTHIKVE